jgi:monoamine oxidase
MLRWIDGRLHTEEMLADPKVLDSLGLNQREVQHLRTKPFWDLASLYYTPYLDAFTDEYQPFDAGLNHLDGLTTNELFAKDGASRAALSFIGGNQTLTDTFARKLGDRVRLNSPITGIEHGKTGVRVTCRSNGETVRHEADYLVSAISAVMLRSLPANPAWPAAKAFALNNVPYYFDTRVVFQTRSKFWTRDAVSPNMEINQRSLTHVWSTGDDVDTRRGLIVGTASGAGTADAAAATYRKHYPGKSLDIEKADVIAWATNRWASACETTAYKPGELAKLWPALVEPVGRVHFVGAYADNLNWGMEAATRSASRVAEAIDRA